MLQNITYCKPTIYIRNSPNPSPHQTAIGTVKLVVGIRRSSQEKVQYCITAIQTK